MRITDHYKISGPVPFLDVDVSKDNRLFVDPRAVRLCARTNPYALAATTCIDSFTTTLFNHVLSSDAVGRRLLEDFTEPWETRLGMSATGFHGHGGAQEIGGRIWDALTTNLEALLRVGALCHLEELALFVDGIDRDIVSDVTTRIVFGTLLDFTKDMIVRYPQLQGDGLELTETRLWDPVAGGWTLRSVEVPSVNGKPLVLVPRDWARGTLLMSARRFYDTAVLDRVQLEHLIVGAQGEVLKTPKNVLSQQPQFQRGRETNLRVTKRALNDREDLLARFRAFVDGKYEPYSDEDLLNKIA